MKNLSRPRMLYPIFFVLFLFFLIQSCAPVFSELQSARTVGEDNLELTPLYSSTSSHNDRESENIQNHVGLQLAYGISEEVDIRARYERIWLKDFDEIGDGIDILGIGPKFSIVKDKVAFSIPLGRALGESSKDSWILQPTVLLSQPVIPDKIEATLSPKGVIFFCDNCDSYLAANLGLSFSSNLNKWAIRPEYGMLFKPGESGHLSQFSIGISTTIGKRNLIKDKP